MAIGTALGGLGGWLAEQRSWHYAFSLVGLAGMAYCGVLVLLLREAPPGGAGEAAETMATPKPLFTEALRSLFACGSFILALVSWAMVGVYGWTVGGWLPVFLQEHFRIGQGAAGLFGTSYSAVVGAVGMLFGGAWADRWGRRNGRAPMFVPAIGLLVATPCLILTANCGIFALVVGAIILYRFFSGFIDSNMMPILCEIIDRRYRATAYGLLNTVGVIAGGLGIYGAGVLRDRKIDLSVVFDLVAVTMVLCAVFLFFMKPRPPGRAGDNPAVPIRVGVAGSLPPG
jgi:MFS family permease